jgi:3-oxoacyl-[acyl-carrier protein] reductase
VAAHAAECDLADKTAIPRYIAGAAEALGGIDILVNNASGFGATDDEEGWAKSLDIDMMATVRASHAAIPFIEQAGGGAILNISSISGYHASTRQPPYAAVKAAVINYTLSQALTLAPKRIRVNAIAPGSIEFPGGIWDRRKTADPKLYNAILRSIPWGRLGRPEEVASVAVFLVSGAAAWVTGQTLIVDGGQTLG